MASTKIMLDEEQIKDRMESRKVLVASIVLALFFIAAAVLKILDPQSFATDIKHFKVLPLRLVNGAALLVPWWEIGAGSALLVLRWRRAGALLATLLIVLFLVAISSALWRGLDVSCGCFGPLSGQVGWPLLVLDVVLLGCACGVLWRSKGARAVKERSV